MSADSPSAGADCALARPNAQCGDTSNYPRAAFAANTAQDLALIGLGTALKSRGYRYTTVTPVTHARVNSREGNEWAVDLEGVFGWNRPFRASIIPAGILDLMYTAGIMKQHGGGWCSLLRASTLNGDLFFHSSYPTTEPDAVFFGPDTYRFTVAIDQYFTVHAAPIRRAADIGCGAGPGAIAVARRFPQAQVLAVDINDAALRLARVNTRLSGATNVQPCYSNLLNDIDGNFDLIVANPPYLVDPGRRAYRHGGGLLGAGLSLAIIDAAMQRLNPGGILLLYTGAAIVHGADPLRIAAEKKLHGGKFKWDYREIDPDVFGEELICDAYARADRIAAVLLAVTLAS